MLHDIALPSNPKAAAVAGHRQEVATTPWKRAASAKRADKPFSRSLKSKSCDNQVTIREDKAPKPR